jgi:hypothetical protein
VHSILQTEETLADAVNYRELILALVRERPRVQISLAAPLIS